MSILRMVVSLRYLLRLFGLILFSVTPLSFLMSCKYEFNSTIITYPTCPFVICADNKMVNCNDNFGFEDGLNELREDETFVVQILRKIELAQSEVRKLRARIDKVVSENPGKFTSVNRLNLITPCDPLVNSDRAVSTPKIVNGIPDRSVYITSQHTSEYNMEDLFMPETAVPSHREATPFPDMIESTGLPHVGFSCGNVSFISLVSNKTNFFCWSIS